MSLRFVITLAALAVPLPAAAQVAFDWQPVGRAGNACDPQPQGCLGTVAYRYEIARHEVTKAQYTDFLNAVGALSDPNGLYNASMATPAGGITRSGSDGSYTYATLVDRESQPVNFVSFWDAVRFVNWLHNGQPSGAQDASTTEDGAYRITAGGVASNSIVRPPGALVVLPDDAEWFKAAYYDPPAETWFDYPAGSDATIGCAAPGPGANLANCGTAVGDLTAVGSYPGSASPVGTFDQGGNVREWNETRFVDRRGQRGGSLLVAATVLAADAQGTSLPKSEDGFLGFRVARRSADPVPGLGPWPLLALGVALGAWGLRSLPRAGPAAWQRPPGPGPTGAGGR